MALRLHSQRTLSYASPALATNRTLEEGHPRSSWANAKETRPFKPSWFRSRIFLILASISVWTIWKPLHCQAQAEINPDHYEITSAEPVSRPGNSPTAQDSSRLRRARLSKKDCFQNGCRTGIGRSAHRPWTEKQISLRAEPKQELSPQGQKHPLGHSEDEELRLGRQAEELCQDSA